MNTGDEIAFLINQLRADEGSSITILCDNPEAIDAKEAAAIECNGWWTGWANKRFYGEDILFV